MNIISILIAVLVVVAIVIFHKQIQTQILAFKKTSDKNTPTSVKIDLAIKDLQKKKKLTEEAFKQTNISKHSMVQQAHNELETAVRLNQLQVTVKETSKGDLPVNCRDGEEQPIITKGETFNVTGFSEAYPQDFYAIGKESFWSVKLFDITSKGKNVARHAKLQTIINKLIKRAEKEQELVIAIDNSIESLRNDKKYVKSMEKLETLENFDSSDLDDSLETINAEISAIEDQIDLIDKLNGDYDESNDETPTTSTH